MSEIVFLLEERSMKVFLEGLLPRLFPNLRFKCIAHDGKSDLKVSLPRKLRGWAAPPARFVVVCDQDTKDCRLLKDELRELCRQGRREDTIVRIVCRELEAWYLGDLDALFAAYGRDVPREVAGGRRYKTPDSIVAPSKAVATLIPEFQKGSGAAELAKHVEPSRNRSRSFQVLLRTIQELSRASPPQGRA